MRHDFFKFPSTPHLAILNDVEIRGDKVMSEFERNDFLQHKLIVEEKVDGANLGISFDHEGNLRAQNRGAYLHLPSSGQWKKLGEWLAPRSNVLFDILTDRYILFGEWCYAQHSVFYDRLPDWCLGFDIYDKQAGRFLSSNRRDEFFKKMKIISVPRIAYGCFTLANLTNLLSQSELSSQPMEGIYLRFDSGDWLELRAKLVRPAFVQSMEQHWSHSVIKPNCLNSDLHNKEAPSFL
ncbi:RNA ligase family protein [Nitrosomonas sp. sh817]|uniref:RNA ligase family protein n=1 Tax=Nitrosomonas sp. sh817 TaxID=3070658 RepID=UPI0027DC890C|nr:RNA ligase family protein [Nitrosomonas sp. sh817]WMJ08659.1 RNA ligase family protein [Nitrosomonas sp. sh817]